MVSLFRKRNTHQPQPPPQICFPGKSTLPSHQKDQKWRMLLLIPRSQDLEWPSETPPTLLLPHGPPKEPQDMALPDKTGMISSSPPGLPYSSLWYKIHITSQGLVAPPVWVGRQEETTSNTLARPNNKNTLDWFRMPHKERVGGSPSPLLQGTQ